MPMLDIIRIHRSAQMPSATRKRRPASRLQKNGKISRWGNSLGVRLPREGVARLGLKEGESVDMQIDADSITIRPSRRRRKWTEAELLRGVTPEIAGGEIDWGGPVGNEVL
jgi:antitoxin MazE